MLEEECKAANVKILINCKASDISKNDSFSVETNLGVFTSENLVVACGGASIPKMGATTFGYDIAKKFGHKIINVSPALVPLTFSGAEKEFCSTLAGISLSAIATCKKVSFIENILFTHKGMSGPAILQISSYLKPGECFNLNISNLLDLNKAITESPKAELKTAMSAYYPSRFAEQFTKSYFPSKPLNQLSKKNIEAFDNLLKAWTLCPSGTEGFDKAEVTLGGVDTKDLSSKTMESNKVKGLYFIGEVVDVTGWLGGYNFQWAWSSAFACGNAI